MDWPAAGKTVVTPPDLMLRRMHSMRRSVPAKPVNAEQMRSHAGDAVQLLKALANERRLMILCLLAEGDRSVGELNAQLDLSQSALSQHLAVLREDGLVTTRREGQLIFYGLAAGPAKKIIETLHGLYCSVPK